ncbi:hypothetical protein MP228_008242 [Amoeboaphelidium protococcarum]|nr:hypothetical protein MP228_008242 [Amoeboaphelidium protococcarum]
MSIIPTFNQSPERLNPQVVRVEPSGYIEPNSSRSGSTVDILDEVEDDIDDDLEQNVKTPLQELLQSHCSKLDEFVQKDSVRVSSLSDDNGSSKQVRVIVSPHASKLKHILFHLALYRNILSLDHGDAGLDNLATLLKVSREEWVKHWQQVSNNQTVQMYLKILQQAESKPDINNFIVILVCHIAITLQVAARLSAEHKSRIGGLMAKSEYDYQSCMDVCFQDCNHASFTLLGTELKSRDAFPDNQHWYQDSRTAQMFAALYSLNAPIFLLSPVRFKIFVENEGRNEVYTYPFSADDGANASEPIGDRLVKALIICLLRKPSEQQLGLVSRLSKTPAAKSIHSPEQQSQRLVSGRKRSQQFIPDSIQKVKVGKRVRHADNNDDNIDEKGIEEKRTDMSNAARIVPRFKCGEAVDGSILYQEVRVEHLTEFIQLTGSLDHDDESQRDGDEDFPAVAAVEMLNYEEWTALDHFQTHYLSSSDCENC